MISRRVQALSLAFLLSAVLRYEDMFFQEFIPHVDDTVSGRESWGQREIGN